MGGKNEQSYDNLKNMLYKDSRKDFILRYGGVYTVALAYAGTSNYGAIRKLLHIVVSDTPDDVRRAAVTSLALVLFKNPGQVPRIVQLLSESYNPHVRCGATLALGTACTGTGLQDATSSPSMSSARSLYVNIVADKHKNSMARFDTVLGQGLIDAGGRESRWSHNTSAIVGDPLAHCACLAFEPTAIIGLNGDLEYGLLSISLFVCQFS
ncbi:hypothetical protein DFH11DRAFT_1695055 [Phellopilus nigrolimitatus]|nr:hypothetical protein DFH11DRAFT_1695055 [Phellopilus nigrolimitatus]